MQLQLLYNDIPFSKGWYRVVTHGPAEDMCNACAMTSIYSVLIIIYLSQVYGQYKHKRQLMLLPLVSSNRTDQHCIYFVAGIV